MLPLLLPGLLIKKWLIRTLYPITVAPTTQFDVTDDIVADVADDIVNPG